MNVNFTPFPVAKVDTSVPLTTTESASKEISDNTTDSKYLTDHIRVSVKGSGCNGFSYVLEFVEKVETEDLEFNSNTITIVVDPKSYVYVKGLEIDYMKEGFKQGFIFNNPNEKSSCGCGESFSIT